MHSCVQVVQAIGSSESDLLGFVIGGNPKKVDGDGAINIVNAAAAVGVTQYVMVTSMGTGKIGFPASKILLVTSPATGVVWMQQPPYWPAKPRQASF